MGGDVMKAWPLTVFLHQCLCPFDFCCNVAWHRWVVSMLAAWLLYKSFFNPPMLFFISKLSIHSWSLSLKTTRLFQTCCGLVKTYLDYIDNGQWKQSAKRSEAVLNITYRWLHVLKLYQCGIAYWAPCNNEHQELFEKKMKRFYQHNATLLIVDQVQLNFVLVCTTCLISVSENLILERQANKINWQKGDVFFGTPHTCISNCQTYCEICC